MLVVLRVIIPPYSWGSFFSYVARDPQARSITFWNLGTLSGADWSKCYTGRYFNHHRGCIVPSVWQSFKCADAG